MGGHNYEYISHNTPSYIVCNLGMEMEHRTNQRQITEKLVLPTKNIPFFTQKTGQNICRVTGLPDTLLFKKTKPDSLTNQGLPGLNTANICRFLTTNKFLPVFFILSTHLSDYMHCRYVLIHTKVMPHLYPST